MGLYICLGKDNESYYKILKPVVVSKLRIIYYYIVVLYQYNIVHFADC